MPLASLSFSDPLMLAGLAAALIPIILHLLNRMRAPLVPFPTLRFLKITAQKTARRRQLQQVFLLLVRILVFALIALAVAAPLIRGGSPALAYTFLATLLAALALLTLALILATTSPPPSPKLNPTPSPSPAPSPPPAQNPELRTHHFPLRRLAALLTLLIALALAAFSAYALASDRYFSPARPAAFTGQNTALVILFDNSHSMLAHLATSSQTRLTRAKSLARDLLGTSLSPREAAILPTNPPESPTPAGEGLTTNMSTLAGYLENLQPTAAAKPMPERLRTALALLHSSSQPSKLLVIISDFAGPSFADPDLFAPLKNLPWREDLQLVLLPAVPPDSPDAHPADVAITSFQLAENSPRPAVGTELTFEAQILNNADTPDSRDLTLSIDDQPADAATPPSPFHPRVQLGPAGTPTAHATIRIPYRLRDPGWHRFTIQLTSQGAADAMPWDDSRQLALHVADQIRVLVLGPETGPTPRPRSAAFYFQAALAPFAGTRQQIPWPIQPTYRGIDQLQSPADLQPYSAIFLCDIPKISAPLADALATYAKSPTTGTTTGEPGPPETGRLIWILGPSIDSSSYNQILFPRGLLPAPLAQPLISAKALPLDWVDTRSPLFANLFPTQDPFRTALITARWSLANSPPIPNPQFPIPNSPSPLPPSPSPIPNSQFPIPPASSPLPLARLADSSPLLLRHSLPTPTTSAPIYTLLTSPAANWSNLGGTTLLVPLASRVALGDTTASTTPTSFDTGQPVPLHLPLPPTTDPASRNRLSIDVTTPGTPGNANLPIGLGTPGTTRNANLPIGPVTTPAPTVLNITPTSPTSPQFLFTHTASPGTYTWKSSDSHYSGTFVVNPPGTEADLFPADLPTLARQSSLPANPAHTPPTAAPPTLIASSVPDLLAQLAHRSEPASLTPGILALALIAALLEALLANRHRPS